MSRYRATPYRQTPGFRRINDATFAEDISTRTEDRVQIDEQRTGMTRKQWKTFKMTPLHNFSLNRLRTYARSLSSYIQSQSKDADTEETVDSASFRAVNGLQKSRGDPKAVEIVLKQRNSGNDQKVACTMYLCGVDIELTNLPHPFVHYPVLLINGSVVVSRLLHAWFLSEFDCSISPLKYSSTDLFWLVSMLSNTVANESRSTKLSYHAPGVCEGLNNITVNINSSDCHRVWTSIHIQDENDDDNVYVKDVEMFVSSLEQHFFHHFRLDLSMFKLDKIGTSVADVATAGAIKIHHKDHVLSLLSYLTDMSLIQLRL